MEFNLNEMASERSRVINRIGSYSQTLGDHVLKCVVYKDKLPQYLDGWKDEIAEYLWLSGDMLVKRQRKLRPTEYQSYLFDEYANEFYDYRACLGHFLLISRKTGNYPAFDITDSLVEEFMNIHQTLAKATLLMLSSKTVQYDLDDYRAVVSKVFN